VGEGDGGHLLVYMGLSLVAQMHSCALFKVSSLTVPLLELAGFVGLKAAALRRAQASKRLMGSREAEIVMSL